MVKATSERYSSEAMRDRACYRIAWNVWHLWEETGLSDTRLFQEPLVADELVTVGQSKSGGNRKEHVIPRRVICNRCHLMLQNGATIESIGQFIKENLKIVFVSKEETEKLNKKNHLNLRQTMPDEWTFENGSKFARLDAAGIEYDLYENW